jgi:N-methylhydantoinase A
LRLAITATGGDFAAARKGERLAYFPESEGFTPTPIYDRYQLSPGATFTGPAIVEERESTVIVGPRAQCHIDEHYNLVVEVL